MLSRAPRRGVAVLRSGRCLICSAPALQMSAHRGCRTQGRVGDSRVLAARISTFWAHADRSPLRELEHDLHTVVAFGILPVFAFANSGISLSGIGLDYLLHPVPLGIAAGLFIGKQSGVFVFCWLAVKLGIAALPDSVTWRALYGAAVLSGIGFTMSLFIASLAFEETDVNLLFDERLGIIVGSLLSGILSYFWLRWVLKSPAANAK